MSDPLLDQILEMSIEAEDAHTTYLAAKEAAKAAKDKWDGLMETIMARLKRRREEDNDPDRLKFRDDVVPATVAGDVDFSQPAIEGPVLEDECPLSAAQPDSEAWRSEPIANLIRFGLSAKTVELLAEAKLTTVGAIAEWSNDGNQLDEIPGIGAAKATEIEEALDAFWIEQQRKPEKRADDPKSRRKTA